MFLVLVFQLIVFCDCRNVEVVTCGSAVKLVNTDYGVRLHSHNIAYGSGSGQQSVTGVKDTTDAGSYWQVKLENYNNSYCRGLMIKCGQVIRLMHQATGKNLHSHNFQSPLSRNLEVSAFGESGVGDEGDNWEVVCSDDYWTRDNSVRLRHQAISGYLHVSGDTYSNPISGQHEVSVSKSTYGISWKVAEGVFIKSANDIKENLKPHKEEL